MQKPPGETAAQLPRCPRPAARHLTCVGRRVRACVCALLRTEFAKNGIGDMITVTRCNAYTEGFGVALRNKVDAVFLDLPMPWLALPHAYRALRRTGRLCTFSPCIEQVGRTSEGLRALGFQDIVTVECVAKPLLVHSSVNVRHNADPALPERLLHTDMESEDTIPTIIARNWSGRTNAPTAPPPPSPPSPPMGCALPPASSPEGLVLAAAASVPEAERREEPDLDALWALRATPMPDPGPLPQASLRQTRDARGHTSFLTFATLWLKRYRNPEARLLELANARAEEAAATAKAAADNAAKAAAAASEGAAAEAVVGGGGGGGGAGAGAGAGVGAPAAVAPAAAAPAPAAAAAAAAAPAATVEPSRPLKTT